MLCVACLAAAVAVSVDAAAIPAASVSAPKTRSLTLTAAEMFRLAELAKSRGEPAVAADIYAALERSPDPDIRAEARFRHARQLLGEKLYREAALLLRDLVDEKPGAVAARLELAHTLDLLGEPDAALRELRAVQAGVLPPAVARLVDRYSQAVRASRPIGASLEIAVAPSSNINNATRSNTLGTILGDFDIDPHSRAQSGTGISLHGQAYRRLAFAGANNSLLFKLSGAADLYSQTQFNDIVLDLAGGPEFRIGRNQLNLELGATQRWFGQKPFMRSARVGASWARPVGSRMQVRVTGAASLVDNQLNDLEDGKSYGGRIELERALSPNTGIGLNLSVDREALKDPGYSTTGWRAGLIGWHDVWRMTLSAEAEFGKLDADERLALFPNKRADRYSRFSVGVTFRQLQLHGFAPLARFTVERNKSTIEFYDFRRVRSDFGIVRAF